MGTPDHLKAIKERFVERAVVKRPFFISHADWEIFLDYADRDMPVHDIARTHNCSAGSVRQTLYQVDLMLSLPRPTEREWTQVTPNSPMHDLGLSVRALNQLRDLGCSTVEDLLRLDFSRQLLGRASRIETVTALRRNGFAAAAELVDSRSADLQKVSEQLQDLRERIDDQVRKWQSRVESLESRLQRITQGGP